MFDVQQEKGCGRKKLTALFLFAALGLSGALLCNYISRPAVDERTDIACGFNFAGLSG
jgi:hypothetical protein